MRFSRKVVSFLAILLVVPNIVAAEKMYVSDQLLITLRRGKSTEHKILKTIKTGEPLEILERSEGDEYVKVRLESGQEGYVLGQYLTSETPKTIQISRLEKKVMEANQQLARAEAERVEASRELGTAQAEQGQKEASLKRKIEELDRALAQTRKDLQVVKVKYKTLAENSGKVIEITDERDRLLERNAGLSSEVQVLTASNEELLRTGVIKWFLAGGGVFFFGWLIGKISRRKQRALY